MTGKDIAYDPEKVLADGKHTAADCIELGRLLYGTKIPNSRLIMALIAFAKVISGRDEASKQAYRAMLVYFAALALEEDA